MTNRFHLLLETLATSVQRDYQEAREHARQRDSQRAGHEGEATWSRLIQHWGPGWPVVMRKYIVGPAGETNEVDVVILKSDYPAHLRNEPSILVSGVAAAFSAKLTLRKEHITEALEQKQRILEVSGGSGNSVKEVLCGPFPFGLLSHSTELRSGSADFARALQDLYEEVGHAPERRRVSHPRQELDALLVADRAFLSTMRSTVVPAAGRDPMGPSSSLMRHPDHDLPAGAPLAQFVTWLNSKCATDGDGSSLDALAEMFGGTSANGYMTRWPMTAYPEHYRGNVQLLLNEHGNPRLL